MFAWTAPKRQACYARVENLFSSEKNRGLLLSSSQGAFTWGGVRGSQFWRSCPPPCPSLIWSVRPNCVRGHKPQKHVLHLSARHVTENIVPHMSLHLPKSDCVTPIPPSSGGKSASKNGGNVRRMRFDLPKCLPPCPPDMNFDLMSAKSAGHIYVYPPASGENKHVKRHDTPLPINPSKHWGWQTYNFL